MRKPNATVSSKAVVAVPGAVPQALKLALAGKADSAEQMCRRSSPQKSVQADALAGVAKSCIEAHHDKTGFDLFQRATRLSSHCTSANLALADFFLGQKLYARALVHLENLNETHPNSPDLLLALGQAYSASGQNLLASEAYQLARSLAKLPPELLWDAARQSMAAKEYEAAAEALGEVLEGLPGHLPTLNDLGVALMLLDRHEEAAACFEKVIAASPSEIPARLNLTSILKESGKYDEALVHLYHVRGLIPDTPTVYAGIAQALVLQERYSEALEECNTGLKLDPNSAELHHFKGAALRGLRRHDHALAHLEVAQRQHPNNGALLLTKGNVAFEMGDLALAETTLRRLIEVAPRAGSHHRSYARVHKYGCGDAHIATMEQMIGHDSLAESDRMELHFALGKAHDDTADYPKAFHHFFEGNTLKRQTVEFDEDRARQLNQALITMKMDATDSGSKSDSDRPIFIVGMPRSGTSLVEQILASHPDVAGLGERADWQQCLDTDIASWENIVSGPSGEWLARLGMSYVQSTRDDSEGALRSVDKMPANFLYAGLIHLALPNARILHVQRDPLDTCLSCYTQLFSSPHPYSYDLAELGRCYARYATLMDHWITAIPASAMMEISYEAVVGDLETQARRIVDFCGLPWNETCLSFHQSKSTVMTASGAQVRQPIYQTSVSRSEGYREFLGPLVEALSGP